MKLKNQKPIDVDVSLKYTCPNKNCGFNHWIFLREAKIKNFKIVCECGTIFRPERIQKIEIVYDIEKSFEKTVDNPVGSGKIEEIPECISRAVTMMVSLGYPKKDSHDKVVLVYKKEKIVSAAELVKKTISKYFGDI